jgi:hypothetical protein
MLDLDACVMSVQYASQYGAYPAQAGALPYDQSYAQGSLPGDAVLWQHQRQQRHHHIRLLLFLLIFLHHHDHHPYPLLRHPPHSFVLQHTANSISPQHQRTCVHLRTDFM